MRIRELVAKYIRNVEQVLKSLNETDACADIKARRAREVEQVLDHAKRYLEDAVYYNAQKKSGTALASVAYSEGLLDALKMLELVEFEWSKEGGGNTWKKKVR